MRIDVRLARIILITIAFVFNLSLSIQAPALAKANYENEISKELGFRVYKWNELNDTKPRAIIVAIHAFLLDGTRYESIGKTLNNKNVTVVAPDMRGFGHWYHSKEPGQKKLNYKKSKEDIVNLLHFLNKKHPNTPILCMGESMGSNLLVNVIANNKVDIDGLILSSPCAIKRRAMFRPRALRDILLSTFCPFRKINLVPYFFQYAVDDNNIEVNKLTRTKMGLVDLLRTFRMLSKTIKEADGVSDRIPVLVIQGEKDKLCKISKIKNLVSRLRTKDKHFHVVPLGGHIFLESDTISTDVGNAIDKWIDRVLHE